MNQIIKERIEQINRGEVPEGYKKIIDSVVPIDWEQRSFSKLFDFYGGLGKSRDELGETGIPYLHYGDMHRNTFSKVSYEQYLNEPKYDMVINGQETFLLNDGDVVFLDASEDLEGTSRSVMVDNPENKPFISGLHTIIGKGKKNYLQKEFKQYITEPFYVRKQFMRLASGFKVYGLNRETIKKIELAYPKDKTEQQKIGEILSKWDEAIFLQEKLIEKLELQLKSIMQKLLSPQNGWKKVRLGDVGEFSSAGVDKNINEDEDSIYLLNYLDVYRHTFLYRDLFSQMVTSTKTKIQQCKIQKGDIFFTPSSETADDIGNTAVAMEDMDDVVYSYHVIRFKLYNNKYYDERFLNYEFGHSSFVNQLQNYAQGSGTRYVISLKGFEKLIVYVPKSKIEQERIVDILTNFEKNITLQKNKLFKIKGQRKSMKQLLLTGIARVN